MVVVIIVVVIVGAALISAVLIIEKHYHFLPIIVIAVLLLLLLLPLVRFSRRHHCCCCCGSVGEISFLRCCVFSLLSFVSNTNVDAADASGPLSTPGSLRRRWNRGGRFTIVTPILKIHSRLGFALTLVKFKNYCVQRLN
jgi:hypothetical protein